ncbi:MAG: hypothetical protein WB784_13280 [Rhodanobacteraceae bacterium]
MLAMKIAIAAAVFGVLALIAYVGRRMQAPLRAQALFRVCTDDGGIAMCDPRGDRRHIEWSALAQVAIHTTEGGPLEPDVLWCLESDGAKRAIVFPGGASGKRELIRALNERLPAFRNEALIEAMGSTANARFVLWRRAT